VWLAIPIGGFVLGAVVGRWWTVAAAVPFGAYIVETSNLEGHLGTWIALALSVLLASTIAAGVALRRLRRLGA
jgi:hypothetical protein